MFNKINPFLNIDRKIENYLKKKVKYNNLVFYNHSIGSNPIIILDKISFIDLVKSNKVDYPMLNIIRNLFKNKNIDRNRDREKAISYISLLYYIHIYKNENRYDRRLGIYYLDDFSTLNYLIMDDNGNKDRVSIILKIN